MMSGAFNFKKRVFITIFITFAVLFSLHKYWFIYKPLYVSFDIKGNTSCNVQVLLNKKDNDEFLKTKKADINLDLNNLSHVDLKIKKAKHLKRIKFVISDISKNNSLVIKNIQIKNKNMIDVSKFKIEGAGSKIENNALVLEPINSTINLIYPDTLKIKSSIYIDFKLLVIILVLTYLFSYKLSSYAADFKSVKGKSSIEILFLSAFFIFLFVPMINIDKSAISKSENRTLAKWSPLVKNKKINYNFGNDFNNWFNDRFNQRAKFINTYYTILSLFSKDYYEDNIIIYNKKADFSYNKTFNALNRFLKNDSFTDDELEIIKNNLLRVKKYTDDNNVQLYIVLSNDKESIYPEFYPTYYHRNNNLKSRLEQLKDSLEDVKGLNIISEEENILKAKEKQMVFLPYDTHLNVYGSYVEYETILLKLREYFKNLPIVGFENVNIAKSKMRGDSTPPSKYINKEFEFNDYITIKKQNYKKIQGLTQENKSFYFTKYINKNANNNLKVVIIGDSFHTRYLPLLAENFYRVSSLFVGLGYDFILDDVSKEFLFDEKPDILIIETTERFLQRFLKLETFDDIFDTKYQNIKK